MDSRVKFLTVVVQAQELMEGGPGTRVHIMRTFAFGKVSTCHKWTHIERFCSLRSMATLPETYMNFWQPHFVDCEPGSLMVFLHFPIFSLTL